MIHSPSLSCILTANGLCYNPKPHTLNPTSGSRDTKIQRSTIPDPENSSCGDRSHRLTRVKRSSVSCPAGRLQPRKQATLGIYLPLLFHRTPATEGNPWCQGVAFTAAYRMYRPGKLCAGAFANDRLGARVVGNQVSSLGVVGLLLAHHAIARLCRYCVNHLRLQTDRWPNNLRPSSRAFAVRGGSATSCGGRERQRHDRSAPPASHGNPMINRTTITTGGGFGNMDGGISDMQKNQLVVTLRGVVH